MKFVDRLIIKKRHLIFEEEDMVRVLSTIDTNHDRGWLRNNVAIGNCGWKDSTKWFITFDASNARWDELVKTLEIKRIWKMKDIPLEKTVGKVYSDD